MWTCIYRPALHAQNGNGQHLLRAESPALGGHPEDGDAEALLHVLARQP